MNPYNLKYEDALIDIKAIISSLLHSHKVNKLDRKDEKVLKDIILIVNETLDI